MTADVTRLVVSVSSDEVRDRAHLPPGDDFFLNSNIGGPVQSDKMPTEPQQYSVAGDRAGSSFWNSLWMSKRKSNAVGSGRLKGWERQYTAFFDEAFRLIGEPRGRTLLEVGCGDSAWLPYFARHWGLRVSGLDYSPVGCEHARKLAQSAGVEADIVCADLFTPPPSMEGSFDIVVTIGVVEHFDDTAATLAALARFLKPGGILVTIVPNIAGMIGSLQKVINRPIYDIHVPLDLGTLRDAHARTGLSVVAGRYLMSVNFGVINLVGQDPSRPFTRLKRVMLAGLIGVSRAVWLLERATRPLPALPYVSPYVTVVAQKS